MKNKNRSVTIARMLVPAAVWCAVTGPALAQVSEEERSAAEEAQRQVQIARTFEANKRQLIMYDRDGRELGTLGEPDLYNAPLFSPDLSVIVAIRIDLQEEKSDLWILDVGTGDATQITASGRREGVQTPVWSPDSREVAYVALRDSYFNIYRQRADGEGEPELVYRHEGGPINLGDWSLDGRYLSFSASDLSGGRLYVLDLEGDGEPVVVAQSEHTMMVPRFSPDGRYLSYFSDETGRNEYYVTSATPDPDGAAESRQLTTEGAFGIGAWDADDPVYYYLGAERRIMALPVDTSGRFELGEPQQVFTVPDGIPAAGGGGLVTLSRDGERLIFALPPARELQQIVVLDREGNELSRLGEPDQYLQPSFSPDGSKIVALRRDEQTGTVDVWTFDAESGEGTQVTATVNIGEQAPVWMPDGEHVAYSYFDEDYSWIYRKSADGLGEQELLYRYTPGAFITLMDVSADGKYLTFESFGYVVSVPLTGDDPLARKSVDLLREEYEVSAPRFSPDARFVAYTYNDSGRQEVYLSAIDSATGIVNVNEGRQVSDDGTIGGIAWRADGKELFYISENLDTSELNDVRVMAVSVATSPALEIGAPQVLFELTLPPSGDPSQWQNVSPDGQRFLFALPR